MTITKEQYLHESQFALFACQMVEETLKSFLMYAREVNGLSSDEYGLVRYTDAELDDLPLGPLIKSYEKLCPNSAILRSLHALRPERNHCAHRALVLCVIMEARGVPLDDEFNRMNACRELAVACMKVLTHEMQSASARLDELRAVKQ